MGNPSAQSAAGPALELSVASLAAWTGPSVALAALAAWWPLARWAGARGADPALLAALLTLPTMLAGAAFVFWLARKGPAAATFGFVGAGPVRMILVAGMLAVCLAVLEAAVVPLVSWTVVLYVAALAGEAAWLTRALRRHALRVARGPYADAPRIEDPYE